MKLNKIKQLNYWIKDNDNEVSQGSQNKPFKLIIIIIITSLERIRNSKMTSCHHPHNL